MGLQGLGCTGQGAADSPDCARHLQRAQVRPCSKGYGPSGEAGKCGVTCACAVRRSYLSQADYSSSFMSDLDPCAPCCRFFCFMVWFVCCHLSGMTIERAGRPCRYDQYEVAFPLEIAGTCFSGVSAHHCKFNAAAMCSSMALAMPRWV